MFPGLLDYAREHSMNIRGPLLELLWIDVHTTKHVEEQVTELQLKVVRLYQQVSPLLIPSQLSQFPVHIV